MKIKNEFDCKELILPRTATVHRAIEVMTGPEGRGIVLVAGPSRKLEGVVVDSDIRKAILKGIGLECPLSKVLNPRPVTLPYKLPSEDIVRFFRKNPRASIPLVDAKGIVRGLAQMSEYLAQPEDHPNWVVLMVGGEGRRLLPLTKSRPKPLLPVGDKPILETIIEQFSAAGFKNFILAVNHQAEQILEHFGNGRKMGANIRYIQERKAMGTAGSLSLLGRKFSEPLIVMNGDLLTKIDFKALLRFHEEEGVLATVCVREYDFQVPYGVIQMENDRLTEIVEKPTQRFFVNAGIYVLDPKVLSLVPRKETYDMPRLLEKVNRRKKGAVGCFPIREYWIDVGQIPDYQKAQREYGKNFSS